MGGDFLLWTRGCFGLVLPGKDKESICVRPFGFAPSKIPTLRLRSGQAFSRKGRARNGAPGEGETYLTVRGRDAHATAGGDAGATRVKGDELWGEFLDNGGRVA